MVYLRPGVYERNCEFLVPQEKSRLKRATVLCETGKFVTKPTVLDSFIYEYVPRDGWLSDCERLFIPDGCSDVFHVKYSAAIVKIHFTS